MSPVGFGKCGAAPAKMPNCSMIDAPSEILGTGKSSESRFETQTLFFELSARPRTLIPVRKDSTLEGSSAGNRTTVSDEELATQTRFLVVDDNVEG